MVTTPTHQPDPHALWNALAPDQRDLLLHIATSAREEGGEAYLVGGPVRDLLRGETQLRDIDMTTTVDARCVAAQLAEAMNVTVSKATEFGTATVTVPDRDGQIRSVDIATTRTETYPRPGALPVVTFPASIQDDLSRRDFTINGMALPVRARGFGDVLDLFGGFADLRSGLIRILHDASFRDDPTRLFRALRYAARFGFALEPHSAQLFMGALTGNALASISASRRRHEIELGMLETDGVVCLEAFATQGLLTAASPALMWSDTIAERLRRLLPAIRDHMRRSDIALDESSHVITQLWPVWAAFVCDQDDASLERLFADIPMTKAMQTSILHLVQAYRHRDEITAQSPPLSTLASWFSGVPHWIVPYFFDEHVVARVAALDARARHIQRQNQTEGRLRGDALIALGVRPGKGRRNILDALQHARLDSIVETTQDELEFVRRYVKEHDLKP